MCGLPLLWGKAGKEAVNCEVLWCARFACVVKPYFTWVMIACFSYSVELYLCREGADVHCVWHSSSPCGAPSGPPPPHSGTAAAASAAASASEARGRRGGWGKRKGGVKTFLAICISIETSLWSAVRLSRGALRFVGCLDSVCCVWHCSGHGRYQAPGRARERASRALGSGARAWTTRRP